MERVLSLMTVIKMRTDMSCAKCHHADVIAKNNPDLPNAEAGRKGNPLLLLHDLILRV